MHRDLHRPPVRVAFWGPSGIAFWVRSQGRPRRVAGLTFAVGPLGPYAGLVGSPLRRQYEEQVQAWVKAGELPEEAVFH